MTKAFGIILMSFSVLAFYFFTRVFYNQRYKEPVFRAFSLTSLASCIWSMGYGVMCMDMPDNIFWYYRCLGLVGLFMYLIAAQILIGIVADYSKKRFAFIAIEGIIGIAILFLVLDRKWFEIIETEYGRVTVFLSNTVAISYTVYILIVTVIFISMSIGLTNKKYMNYVRSFAKRSLIVEGLIVIGVFIDTVLPALGTNLNIPASTLFQFVGVEILYLAVHAVDRSKINLSNMSGYIYQSVKSPILIFDRNNCLKICNKEAENLFDISSESELEEIDFWNDIFEVNISKQLSENSESLVIDQIYKKKEKNCRLYIDPIYDSYHDFIGYIVMVSDITLQVQYTEHLEEEKNKADEANMAKSTFLANMSHEIRTPMNAIIGFSELAQKDPEVSEKGKEYITDINQSAQSLLELINDILDISKIEAGKMELVNQNYKTKEIFDTIGRIIGMHAGRKGLKLKMEIAKDFPSVLYGDKDKIRGMLINLMNNGIKYTNEGHIMLKASVINRKNDVATLRFQILDTGIGIRKGEIDKIFNTFQRVDMSTNVSTEGSGLGLSITKGYADLMGGKITVDSSYGKGSLFTLTLDQKVIDDTPIESVQDRTAETVEKAENSIDLSKNKVLVVDDNAINLKLISMVLSRLGVEADRADGGLLSVQMCEEKEYDLIFMDQMMPQVDGVEAMKRIRALGANYEANGNCKIIALTANAIDGVREELIAEGFDEYLAKPIDFDQLYTILKKWY